MRPDRSPTCVSILRSRRALEPTNTANREINMLNELRREPAWGARMKGILAAVLLTGSGAAMADVSYTLCAQAGVPAAPSPLAGAVTKVYGYAADCATAVTQPGGPVLTATV